mmetsp:Transcript_31478/g.76118  ORF Transcript_31478/g.76118 Transcript_31478/m.76118 type:complete len:126 (-) Transcript_31478:484-861(-)
MPNSLQEGQHYDQIMNGRSSLWAHSSPTPTFYFWISNEVQNVSKKMNCSKMIISVREHHSASETLISRSQTLESSPRMAASPFVLATRATLVGSLTICAISVTVPVAVEDSSSLPSPLSSPLPKR